MCGCFSFIPFKYSKWSLALSVWCALCQYCAHIAEMWLSNCSYNYRDGKRFWEFPAAPGYDTILMWMDDTSNALSFRMMRPFLPFDNTIGNCIICSLWYWHFSLDNRHLLSSSSSASIQFFGLVWPNSGMRLRFKWNMHYLNSCSDIVCYANHARSTRKSVYERASV